MDQKQKVLDQWQSRGWFGEVKLFRIIEKPVDGKIRRMLVSKTPTANKQTRWEYVQAGEATEVMMDRALWLVDRLPDNY